MNSEMRLRFAGQANTTRWLAGKRRWFELLPGHLGQAGEL
jgi:hypothetical protein